MGGLLVHYTSRHSVISGVCDRGRTGHGWRVVRRSVYMLISENRIHNKSLVVIVRVL